MGRHRLSRMNLEEGITLNGSILVTGGAGFIGSTLVRHLLDTTDARVVTLDALTYAGSLASLGTVLDDARHTFVQGDITDSDLVRRVFDEHAPNAVLHLAAESHVDRSIDGPSAFVDTNVVGTLTLLDAARRAWRGRDNVRFVHVSTDEVFGSLAANDPPFMPGSCYDPRSPYAASKAASDHLARAWFHTYGLPVIVTNCSNNYGPRQHPEKLLPTIILRGARGDKLPVYGDGDQIRDWLHVHDHARGIHLALEHGTPGDTYLFGARNERTNLEVVTKVCSLLDDARADGAPHAERITHVANRPGHDRRYAVDPSHAERALDWKPEIPFDDGLASTVDWYLLNPTWVDAVRGTYDLTRQGLGTTK